LRANLIIEPICARPERESSDLGQSLFAALPVSHFMSRGVAAVRWKSAQLFEIQWGRFATCRDIKMASFEAGFSRN
jgi:hypothetical protein